MAGSRKTDTNGSRLALHKESNARRQHGEDGAHHRTDGIISDSSEYHAQDADRKVVNQHFKSGGHVTVHCGVKFFDDPACKRSHNHGAHKHRLSFCTANACDASHYSDCAHHASAFPADHLTALRGNQHRKQIAEHVRLDGGQLCIGQPTFFDKQCGDKAPCNECANVGHDHGARNLPNLAIVFFIRQTAPFLFLFTGIPEKSLSVSAELSFCALIVPS